MRDAATAIFQILRRFATLLTVALSYATHQLLSNNAVVTAIVVALFLVMPGALTLSISGNRIRNPAQWLIVSVSISTILIMVGSWGFSEIASFLQLSRPLESPVFTTFWWLLLGTASFYVDLFDREVLPEFQSGSPYAQLLGSIILAAVPLTAWVGSRLLTQQNNDSISITLTVIFPIALLAMLLLRNWLDRIGIIPMFLFTVSLSISYLITARSSKVFGWDIQKEFAVAEFTRQAGAWIRPEDGDAYASMLSLTVLPNFFSVLAGIETQYSLTLIFPCFLALSVVSIFVTCRLFASPGISLTVTYFIVLGSQSFARQMPALARQELAFLLVAATVLVVLSTEIDRRQRKILFIIFATGIGFSHYTTAFTMVGMFFIIAAVILITHIRFTPGKTRGRVRIPISVRWIPNPKVLENMILSPAVLAISVAGILGWNLGITQTTAETADLGAQIGAKGLELIISSGKNPIDSWLNGPTGGNYTMGEYVESVSKSAKDSEWMQLDEKANDISIDPAVEQNTFTGIVPAFAPVWESFVTVQRQIGIFIQALAVLTAIWLLVKRKVSELSVDLVFLGLAFLVLLAVLRLSGTVAKFYNPERGALNAAYALAPLIALAITALVPHNNFFRKTLLTIWLFVVSVAVTTAIGLHVLLFGGSPPASVSNSGEEFERLYITPAEYATAQWLGSRPVPNKIVFADRYGFVALISVDRSRFDYISQTIIPQGVDRRGLVYASRTNFALGRARGNINGVIKLFIFPTEFYESTRAVVFSTETTRVYN